MSMVLPAASTPVAAMNVGASPKRVIEKAFHMMAPAPSKPEPRTNARRRGGVPDLVCREWGLRRGRRIHIVRPLFRPRPISPRHSHGPGHGNTVLRTGFRHVQFDAGAVRERAGLP